MPDSYFELMGVTIVASFGLTIVGRSISHRAEKLLSQELKAKLIDLNQPYLFLPPALIGLVPLGVGAKLMTGNGSWSTVQLLFFLAGVSQIVYSGLAVLWLRNRIVNNGFPTRFIRRRTVGLSLSFSGIIAILMGTYWVFQDLQRLWSSAG